MHYKPSSGTAILAILIVGYILRSIYQHLFHARQARSWSCKPPAIRPYRYPLAIDVLQRYIKADGELNTQNDDLAIYEEMGRCATWQQQILGNWHVVTNDPKNIQALLATQFKDFELGPVRRGSFAPLIGDGIFTLDGKGWEHSRAMLRPQFSRNQVSDLKLEEEHVQLLFARISSSSDQWTGKVDLRPLFFNLTLDSATQFLFGESVYAQRLDQSAKKCNQLDLDWTSFAQCFDDANNATTFRTRLFDFYWLYNPTSFQRDCAEVHKLVDYFVNKALSNEKAGANEHSYVFSHELAKVTRDRVEMRSQLLNILLAGRDTTAGLLGFTFYFLARHQHVYDKLRLTILEDFGTGTDKISFGSLKACTYLQHVMNEVLRLEPSVPENARRAIHDTTLPRGGGSDGTSPVYIRAGTEVLYYPRTMHRREDLWGPDAHEFNPERWQKNRPGWEYLPFNGGPRICLGQQFALTEAGYVIVRLLQKYDRIENLDDKPQKHRFMNTIAPVEVLVRLHEASVK